MEWGSFGWCWNGTSSPAAEEQRSTRGGDKDGTAGLRHIHRGVSPLEVVDDCDVVDLQSCDGFVRMEENRPIVEHALNLGGLACSAVLVHFIADVQQRETSQQIPAGSQNVHDRGGWRILQFHASSSQTPPRGETQSRRWSL